MRRWRFYNYFTNNLQALYNLCYNLLYYNYISPCRAWPRADIKGDFILSFLIKHFELVCGLSGSSSTPNSPSWPGRAGSPSSVFAHLAWPVQMVVGARLRASSAHLAPDLAYKSGPTWLLC